MSSLRKYLTRRPRPQTQFWTDQTANRRHAATARPQTTPPVSLTLR
ncbi:hypothetical protein GCM10027517_05440 [Phycicoccus ginsengisoli]